MAHFFAKQMQEMGKVKEVKSRHKYDDEKTEILRMRIAVQINSGKDVKEISKTFDIAENVLFRWKTNQNMNRTTEADQN